MGKSEMPEGYKRCCDSVLALIPVWVQQESQSRFVDLQWHDWGTICYAGSLKDELGVLANSDDARALLAWLDEKTARQGTLLMAKVALEMLGYKRREHMRTEGGN